MICIWFVGQENWHAFCTWWKWYPCRGKCYSWRGSYVFTVLFHSFIHYYVSCLLCVLIRGVLFPLFVKELSIQLHVLGQISILHSTPRNLWVILFIALPMCKTKIGTDAHVCQIINHLSWVHLAFSICHIEGYINLSNYQFAILKVISIFIILQCRKRKLKVSVVAVPKTIDNDILLMDKTFGFDTAVEEAQRAINSAYIEVGLWYLFCSCSEIIIA